MGDEEIGRIKKSGTKVVHCPKSNMKLADGVMPIKKMLEAGLPVSIATDGCASNDLLDMWEEMRAALFLARVSAGDAGCIEPEDVFRMATEEAAKACRVEAGVLEPGRFADIAVVDLSAVHLRPIHNLMGTLVYCTKSEDVRDTIINGEVIMRNRKFVNIDEQALLSEADQVGLLGYPIDLPFL